MITSQQYNVSNQTIRNLHIKINLLNYSYQTVDSLEGNAIGGSINIEANADIRRTCQIDLVVTNNTFNVQSGGRIWLDKYLQIYTGIDDIHSGETVWFNQGIYLINQPSYTYDSESNILSFEGVDLMAKMTGARNGYLTGDTYIIPQGSDIRGSVIAALQMGNFYKYVINAPTIGVPYEMRFDQGSTIYNILDGLRNIYPNYQIYFDVNGIFHFEPIPTGANESVIIDDSTWTNNVISEQIDVDFQNVKNSIEVYGKAHDVQSFATNVSFNQSPYGFILTIPGITSLSQYIMIGFITPISLSTTNSISLNVNSLGYHPMVDLNGNYITSLDYNTYYVCSYQSNNTWLFMGHQQAYGRYLDSNPDSPFYIEEAQYTATRTVVHGNIINIDVTSFGVGNTVGFIIKEPCDGNIEIGTLGYGYTPLYNEFSQYITHLDPYIYYTVQFKGTSPNYYFLFLGARKIEEIKYVCYGGEYENIQSDELALQRAKYEIYKRCRLNDAVTLSTIPIYYLDVYQLASYTPKANNSAQTTYQYMIQSISFDLSNNGLMTVNMSKYYPLYPVLP